LSSKQYINQKPGIKPEVGELTDEASNESNGINGQFSKVFHKSCALSQLKRI
jgi:hypothetical protein